MIKKSLLILAVVLLLFSQANYVFALELAYPEIPGFGGGPGARFDLNQFIQYVFAFIILSAGGIGVITIAIAGFQILMSFGSPAARGAANERIRNAILGIILLVSSVLILRTINPELVAPRAGFAGLQPGVYLRNFVGTSPGNPTGLEYKEAPDSMADTSTLPSNTELYYYCTTPGRDLLVNVYAEKDFELDGNETTRRVRCNDYIPVTNPVYSYEAKKDEPGIYFYGSEDCTGYSSGVQKSSRNIGGIYRQLGSVEIKSIRIFNGISADERYGFILNKEGNGLENGECSDPIVKFDPGEECYKLGDVMGSRYFSPFFAYIIKYNPIYFEFGSPGSNVQIYSDNLFARLDQQDSILIGPDEQDYNIGRMYIYPKYRTPPDESAFFPEGNPDNLIREQFIWDNMVYTGGNREDECCIKENPALDCRKGSSREDTGVDPTYGINHRNCVKGVEINGDYYVFLYSRNTTSGSYMCQDFFSDWDDIPSQTNLLSKDREIYKFVIIPRR